MEGSIFCMEKCKKKKNVAQEKTADVCGFFMRRHTVMLLIMSIVLCLSMFFLCLYRCQNFIHKNINNLIHTKFKLINHLRSFIPN